MSDAYNHIVRRPVKWDNNADIKFQIVSWYDKDEGCIDPITLEDLAEDPQAAQNVADPKEYTMYLFGLTEKGESVSIKVTGFQPFFYIKIPERWSQLEIERFIRYIQDKRYAGTDDSGIKMWYKYKNSIVSAKIVNKHDLDAGFTNGALFRYIGFQFKNYDAFQKCTWMLWKDRTNRNSPANGIKLYESNLPPMLRFMHVQNLLSIGWVTIPAGKYELYDAPASKNTFAQIEAEIHWTNVIPDNDNNLIAPIRQASFDIECFSTTGQVPIPEIPGNECIQIATAIKDYGKSDFTLKHIFTLKVAADIPGAVVENCKTEQELLCKWTKFIQTVDPDILIGYNIFGFDLEYLYIRARMTGCEEAFRYLSKFRNYRCELKESQLKSNAYGDNHWQMVEMPGRSQIDLLPVIKKEKQYTSYKLGFVSQQILKDTKEDLTPKQLFECYKDGSIDSITRIATYCIQDTLLPQLIIDKMNILVNLIEMAKVTRVPLDFLVTRGQQIKVFSQIAETARNANYVLPHVKKSKFVQKIQYDDDDDDDEEGYEGATVLKPVVGSYWDGVAALDFKALYPTTEIDWNLCYTTLVKDDKKYGRISGVQYHFVDIVVDKGNPNIEIVIFEAAFEVTVQFKFYPKVSLGHLSAVDGICVLPKESPWVWRAKFPLRKLKIIQRILPQATTKKVYKWAQSIQGLVPQILINLLNARGRAKKQMAAAADAGDKFMEDVYNGKQLALKVSCNSVYGFTGCVETGKLPCKPIAECTTTIGRGMIDSSKHYAENIDNFREIMKCVDYFPDNYPYVIMNNIKKQPFIGSAELLVKKLFKIDINPEDKKDYYPIDNDDFHIFTDAGFEKVLGLEIRWSDSMYKFHTPKGKVFSMQKYSCNVIYGDTDSIFCNFDTTMHDSMTNKIAYSMVVGAYVADRITEYLRSFNKFKQDKDKWTELEYEKVYGNLLLFTKKRYTGTLYDFNPLKYKYIDKKGIALKRRDYCQLVKDVYASSLEVLFDESKGTPAQRIEIAEKIVINMIEGLLQGKVKPEKLILSKSLRDHYKIREKKKKKNIKGLTFNAGNVYLKDHLVIDHPVLGETQGIVIKKENININDFFSKGAKKYPLELRIESCENDDQLPDIDEKYKDYEGLPFNYDQIKLRKGFEISLKRIINPKTTELELEPVTQAHVRLTRRMYLRDPGSAPVSGERVPFMFVEKPGDVLQHEKAEHPDYVKLHNLKPDPKYYLDNQLRKPIEQLFALLMPDPERLFDPLIRKYQNKMSGQREMTNFIQFSNVNSITSDNEADGADDTNERPKKRSKKLPDTSNTSGTSNASDTPIKSEEQKNTSSNKRKIVPKKEEPKKKKKKDDKQMGIDKWFPSLKK